MKYDPVLVQPMRDELTNAGILELKTPKEVNTTLSNKDGSVLVVVNSVCGCAAGQARPGVLKAIQHTNTPDKSVTVFAGMEVEATEKAREYFTGYMPSSPQIALFKNGELVFIMERWHIESKSADMIAEALTMAFDEHCANK